VIARLALVLMIVGLPATSRADKKETVAQALFEAGRALMEAGQTGEACEKFEQSQRMDPQLGTKLNIAVCWVKLGRLVEGYDLFVEAELEARAPGKTSRLAYAREQIAELEAKLARVTVKAADAEVTVRVGAGGKLVERPRSAWDKIVVAPGELVVEATAPGRRPFRSVRAVRAGEAIEIDVPPLGVAAGARPGTGRTLRTPRIVVAVGGGLVVASMALGLHAKLRYDTAASNNDQATVDGAQLEADIGTGFAVVGAVTATIGLVMYFKHPRGVTVAPATDGSVGIVLGGRY